MKKKESTLNWKHVTYIGIGLLLVLFSSGKVAYDNWDIQDAVQVAEQIHATNNLTKNYQTLAELSDYDGQHQVVKINKNQPFFQQADLSLAQGGWQTFSNLDRLNRVGVANALLHRDLMPTEKRQSIASIYPTGWKQKKISKDEMLYNRSHLIGFQFTGENANLRNLFTGTKALNQDEMSGYENEIAHYIRKSNNHVRYRVTPYFKGDELVARGVEIEAQSVEDNDLRMNIFVYNVQPGYTIDYRTGSAVKTK
ncbi:DNA/RNA non-specific endonuclease [Enterococcus camelliae]|uniref:DNA/RNA non-specific endonuclease n=1 Tax=Enterococcus camelliae TaxID=453959 RepID=A0ABW5TIZ3_9ENTE